MLERLEVFILGWGANEPVAHVAARLIAFAAVLILSLVVFFIASRIVLRIVERMALKTEAHWDDKIVHSRALFWAANLAPAIMIYLLVPTALRGWDGAVQIVLGTAQIYMIVVTLFALDALLNIGVDRLAGAPALQSFLWPLEHTSAIRIVRRGRAPTVRRRRTASITAATPAALSVAPVAACVESKCAPSITTS